MIPLIYSFYCGIDTRRKPIQRLSPICTYRYICTRWHVYSTYSRIHTSVFLSLSLALPITCRTYCSVEVMPSNVYSSIWMNCSLGWIALFGSAESTTQENDNDNDDKSGRARIAHTIYSNIIVNQIHAWTVCDTENGDKYRENYIFHYNMNLYLHFVLNCMNLRYGNV